MELLALHEMHARHLRALRRSSQTVRFYRQAVVDLSRFLEGQGRTPVAAEVTRADLVLCQEAMVAREMKPGAVGAMMRGLRATFRWALDEELLTRDPTAKWPMPNPRTEQPHAITPAEVQACLGIARGMPLPLRSVAIMLTLYDCGVRAGELIGMRVGDVQLDRGMLVIRAETSKTGGRVVPLGIKSARALTRYMHRERRPALVTVEDLWIARDGSPLTKSGLSQLMNRVAQAAGLPRDHVAPHAWRRGCATQLLRNGSDLFTVQTILGHSTLEQSRRYVAYLPTDIQRIHLRASPADRLAHGAGDLPQGPGGPGLQVGGELAPARPVGGEQQRPVGRVGAGVGQRLPALAQRGQFRPEADVPPPGAVPPRPRALVHRPLPHEGPVEDQPALGDPPQGRHDVPGDVQRGLQREVVQRPDQGKLVGRRLRLVPQQGGQHCAALSHGGPVRRGSARGRSGGRSTPSGPAAGSGARGRARGGESG